MSQDSSTDVIISGYENYINKGIASKTLSASKSGKSPEFTKEELLYLNRKAGENEDSELKVITPIPDITLKKGKTELNIGHAVKLVQKMEEKYPTGVSKEQADFINSQPYTAKSIEYGLNQETSSLEMAKKSLESLEILLKPIVQKEESFEIPGGFIQPPIKTVNANAYEIRESVLAHALDFFKWQTDINIQLRGNMSLEDKILLRPTTDDVLEIAQRFYKFVENRR